MFNLVYRSNADPAFNQSQILDLLESSKDFNKTNDITGCLLYFQGTFLQYLEGDRRTILALYDRIKDDQRHSRVTLLCNSHIYSREFKTWDMAYENFLGVSDQLEYLKLLVSSYIENPDIAINPNPTTKSFWNAANKLLSHKMQDRL